jgi:hypothetical protein
MGAQEGIQVTEEQMKNLKELMEIQSKNLTDPYMIGLYNGMELVLSTLEKRTPIYIQVGGENGNKKSAR